MSVNPGVKLFFDRLVWYTRLAGSKRLSGEHMDQRGFRGAVNLDFGPEPDAAWHCQFDDNGFRFRKGRHAAPLGSVRLEDDLFLRLLAGQTSYYTAEMTGKIRVEGDGHSAWVLSSTILQAHARARKKGLLGWIARWHLNRVLKKSGKPYQLNL